MNEVRFRMRQKFDFEDYWGAKRLVVQRKKMPT